MPAAATRPLFHCPAIRLTAFLLGVLLLPTAAPSLAMELEGKTVYTWSNAVKNEYAGSVLDVLKKEGDEVVQDEVVARYRLAPREIDAIRSALSDQNIRENDALINELTAQVQMQGRTAERLRGSVNAGYENPLRLESEEAALELLRTRQAEAKRTRAELAASLAAETKRISEDLGGLPVSRRTIPDAVPLCAPYDGVITRMNLQPGQKIAAKAECFKVAAKAVCVKVQVYAEHYPHLHAGDQATVTIQGFPGRSFPAVLFLLPLKPVDKGSMALSYYEVLFRLLDPDVFVREGLSARVTVP